MQTIAFLTSFLLVWCSAAKAQYTPYYQWTLLPTDQLDYIIGEPSGETALNHAIEMVGYQRNRPASEYGEGTFREAKYVMEKLSEYGFDNAKLERYPGGKAWDGIKGELWEVSPGLKKLADYDDIVLSLAKGSRNTDVSAELVWVEEGYSEDFEKVDVSGKIVVTSSSVSRAHSLAVRQGALGVIAFGSDRELEAPLAIPENRIFGNKTTFGFSLTPRDGYKLRDRLLRGEKIKVHAVVEAQELDYDLQIPTCVIEGKNPSAGEIILSAHIFEGYAKQGANDNVSGSAVILEVARSLKLMFEDGQLPYPERSIRFVWVPEYKGTIPWVKEHREIMDNTLCNLNLDMVGVNLKNNNSFFSLMRTTYGNPHYVNDVLENFYVYMGEVNREILSNRSLSRIVNPVTAPSGSDDPFYYQIEKHYGSSDHEVFNHWSVHVPGVMLITWPDLYYHTSEDIPNKLDPTQLKRAAVIAMAGAYTIASADETMAIKIANAVYGYGTKRQGIELNRAFAALDAADKENFASQCKQSRAWVSGGMKNEKNTLQSVLELDPESSLLKKHIQKLQDAAEATGAANLNLLLVHMAQIAQRLGLDVPDFNLSEAEMEADKLIPVATEKVREGGFGVEREISRLPQETRKKFSSSGGGMNGTELCTLIDGKKSALEIKEMLDAQGRRPASLSDVVSFLHLLEEAGLVIFL